MRREPAEATLADHGGRVAADAGWATLLEHVRLIQGVRVRLAGDAPLQHGAWALATGMCMGRLLCTMQTPLLTAGVPIIATFVAHPLTVTTEASVQPMACWTITSAGSQHS